MTFASVNDDNGAGRFHRPTPATSAESDASHFRGFAIPTRA